MNLVEPVAPLLSSKFLAKFVADNRLCHPKRVKIAPTAGSVLDWCYVNVESHVAKAGGRGVYGWKILEFPGLFLQAIHHAVWISPANRMIDVTPDIRQWKQHVFSANHDMDFVGVPAATIAPLTMNISGLEEVDEALTISRTLTAIRLEHALPNGMLPALDNRDALVTTLQDQARALITLAHAKVSKK